ncbi:NYN domain-containing protein [Agromyces seonyuensis]|uniref:NYN domain-containing protein n=1 Tax=Agromyces seonyuensis TaxID=2662446 RepID=A0A6I4NUK4_9MICO|nr:NYN domain-containing protein [Agromyces seonyuensis]MWB97970.1 NYN domain-containing protein [Agromyces seonyuensis]
MGGSVPQPAEPRVALYFDFDNIVISRYDQLHGDLAYRKDTGRRATPTPRTAERLAEATVDLDAVLDFATTFGTIATARAYADWSTPVNASYRGQLISRAVDLVQLFPLSATKNGADIRLAVDAVEDLFRLPDLTHVVIVAGDSDYVALAQKCKRLGRYVVGIGVAGGTSRALAAACDEFADYDALLTSDADDELGEGEQSAPATPPPAPRGRRRRGAAPAEDAAAEQPSADAPTAESSAAESSAEPAAPSVASTATKDAPARAKSTPRRARGGGKSEPASTPETPAAEPEAAAAAPSVPAGTLFLAPVAPGAAKSAAAEPPTATRNPGRLLRRALELLRAKNDQEWQSSGAVKAQMQRMDPGFQERALGFASFTDFLESRGAVVELDGTEQNRVRIRPPKH